MDEYGERAAGEGVMVIQVAKRYFHGCSGYCERLVGACHEVTAPTGRAHVPVTKKSASYTETHIALLAIIPPFETIPQVEGEEGGMVAIAVL